MNKNPVKNTPYRVIGGSYRYHAFRKGIIVYSADSITAYDWQFTESPGGKGMSQGLCWKDVEEISIEPATKEDIINHLKL